MTPSRCTLRSAIAKTDTDGLSGSHTSQGPSTHANVRREIEDRAGDLSLLPPAFVGGVVCRLWRAFTTRYLYFCARAISRRTFLTCSLVLSVAGLLPFGFVHRRKSSLFARHDLLLVRYCHTDGVSISNTQRNPNMGYRARALLGFRIDQLVAVSVAGIEPRLDGRGRPHGPLLEEDDGLVT